MNRKSLLAIAAGALGLTGCITASDIDHVLRAATTPPPPSAGFIVYVQKEGNDFELYRQDMNGMSKDPNGPYKLMAHLESWEQIRYPGITPDGKYIYFTVRDYLRTNVAYDNFVVANNQGEPIWSSHIEGCPDSSDMNYPSLLSYEDNQDGTISFQLAGNCSTSVGWYQTGLNAQNISTDPLNYDRLSTDWITQLPYTENGHKFFGIEGESTTVAMPFSNGLNHVPVIHANNGLRYTYAFRGTGMPTEQCVDTPLNDVGMIYVNNASKELAGTPSNSLSPYAAYTVQKAFAPSMSSDGKHLLFNSEVYKNDPNRGEELMTLNLPDDLCASYRVVSYPPPPQGHSQKLPTVPFKSEIRVLNSGPGNEYGRFAVNTGHYYTMHRHNDPAANGIARIYIAPDLDTPAIPLNPSAQFGQQEPAWFYQ